MGWFFKKRQEKNGRFLKWITFLLSGTALLLVLFFGKVYFFEENKWKIISAIPSPLRVAGRIIIRKVSDLPYFFYAFKTHNLPVYNLKINQNDLKFLQENLPAPDEYLTDEYRVEVPGVFIYEGKEYEVKVRYRGWAKNHWLWPKKSYKVRFEDNFEGRAAINLIVPSDRSYFIEENNNFRAKQLGLPALKSKFSVLTINGKNPAVYWEVEQWGSEFLESNGLSSDANLYGEAIIDEEIYVYSDKWKKYNEDVRFNKENYAEIDRLLNLLNDASDEVFNIKIFDILDEENFYAWSVHNAVSFSNHQDWGHNMRLYFDPSVGKFKMIPWDVSINEFKMDKFSIDELANPLANRILSNPEFMAERNFRLWNYIKPGGPVENEFAYLDKLYNDVRGAFYQDNIKGSTNKAFDREVNRLSEMLKNNVDFLRGLFIGTNIELGMPRPDNASQINLITKSLSPLIIEEVVINKGRAVEQVVLFNKIIYPKINYLQLPTPEVFANKRIDYYKTFELSEQHTDLELNVDNTFGLENIILKIKNVYTNETVKKELELFNGLSTT